MNLEGRKYILFAIVVSTIFIFIIRLFYLQILDDTWKQKATEMSERKVTIYPSRGLIFDRNNLLMVSNKAVHDLMIIPREVKEHDTTSFCALLKISKDDWKQRYERAVTRPNAPYRPSVFIKQIPPEEYAIISEQLHKYPGFYGQARTLRDYPVRSGALVLGDIGEAGPAEIDANPYYRPGDYIGKSGLEKTYESELRGRRGIKFVHVDVLNNVVGSYADGIYDTISVGGADLISTLDARIQAYGEQLMANKRGSIVAIEPATGEILAMISSPTYDPNLLVGRNRGENYAALKADSLLPLYNRAIKGTYRPGSIWKMVQALIALELGAITPQTRISCNRSIIGCHGSHSYDDLEGAIIHSCNPYFRDVFRRMIEPGETPNRFKDSRIGLGRWEAAIKRFGFGSNLGTDVPGSNIGLVPNVAYYDKIYGKEQWAFSTIYSLSIGEGELLITPIQMANLAAIIANKGYYYSPHVLKSFGKGKDIPEAFREKHLTSVSAEHFEIVRDAMLKVVEEPGGTGSRARIPGISVCGKTGTVQNEPFEDHSVFIAFAPKDDPKIAISVYVENAGFGGQWAAPIASLIIEKYLTDSISDPKKEERILQAKYPFNQ
jgi:penicillin-binding protein 2